MRKRDLMTYIKIKNSMCSTVGVYVVLSIRSVVSTEKDKSVRKIYAGIPAGYGEDLIMKHFN